MSGKRTRVGTPTVKDRMRLLRYGIEEMPGMEGPWLYAGGAATITISYIKTNRILLRTTVPFTSLGKLDTLGRKLCRQVAEAWTR